MPDNYEILAWRPGSGETIGSVKFDSFEGAFNELVKMNTRLAEDKFYIVGVGYPRYDVSPIYEGGSFMYCEKGTDTFGKRVLVQILKIGEDV